MGIDAYGLAVAKGNNVVGANGCWYCDANGGIDTVPIGPGKAFALGWADAPSLSRAVICFRRASSSTIRHRFFSIMPREDGYSVIEIEDPEKALGRRICRIAVGIERGQIDAAIVAHVWPEA